MNEITIEGSVSVARAFAYAAHLGQKYGEASYVTHLDHAVDVAVRFGIKAHTILTAVYLHDTIEDTKVTVEDITYIFGLDVAKIVHAVTDAPGKTRKERHERTYPKIRAAGYPAMIVKLCDRIANVETSARGPNKGKLQMYRKEHPEFREALYIPPMEKLTENAGTRMWKHLDNLLGFAGE